MQLLKELSSWIVNQELNEKDKENEVKENRTKRKNISIKILTPTNDLVGKIIDELDIGSTIADNAIGVSSTVTNPKERIIRVSIFSFSR